MRLVRAGNADVLLLERFDRQKAPEGYTRQGYCSALPVMGLDESEQGRFSYLTFVDRLSSAFPKSWNKGYGEEMFRRLAFSILARNTDNHPRNHGIRLEFTRLGKPTDNSHIESFNGKIRDECLNQNAFISLADAVIPPEKSSVYK